jgi:MYXO-CTERM domain-containing protein
MKRTCLISSALALTVLAPTVASAEPAILYIPTDPVTLRPTGMAPCGASVNSALGCGGASEETEEAPYASAAELTTALTDGLAAYDVLVTNTRPPEYVSYVMMLPSEEEAAKSESFTCAYGGINCGARERNDIISTSGATMYCMDPEITHAAMYAFGRVSGLEGVMNPDDWMNYIPDYTTPPMGFQDLCSDRVQQQGFNDEGDQVDLPLECTSVDHVECPDGMNGEAQQNSHQDLLLYYGERTEDAEAPVLSNIVPEDGAVLQAGDDLTVDVDIMDADPIVGVRWVIASPALEAAGVEGGALSQCTNDVCNGNWDDATPIKATDSDWAFTLAGLPAGDYTITLEAADYHGNVAETVTIMVTIEGGTGETGNNDTGNVDETGSDPDEGNDDNPGFTSGDDNGESDDSGGDGGANDDSTDGGGCSCSTTGTPGGMVLMLLGFVGLGAMRRRC